MNFCPPESSDPHPLLEPRAPVYSNATVRRAFIVWLRCGQRNNFKDVCDYFHHLETMEDQLPADSRASSRHHEFSLFVNRPPTSPYLHHLFPQLYSSPFLEKQIHLQAYIQSHYQRTIDPANNIIKVEDMMDGRISQGEIFAASQVFKAYVRKSEEMAKVDGESSKLPTYNGFVDGLNKNDTEETAAKQEKEGRGATKREIVETSQIIRKYCQDNQIPLKTFLEKFKEFVVRCELNNTVINVGFYIKRKMIHEELKLTVKIKELKKNIETTITEPEMKIKTPEVDVKDSEVETQKSIDKTIVNEAIVDDVKNNTEFMTNLLKEPNSNEVVIEEVEPKIETENKPVSKEQVTFEKVCLKETDKECIQLLDKDEDMKTSNGFSSTHLKKFNTQKCRNI